MHEKLVRHQFDLKWLIRELVNSETYQLGVANGPGTAGLTAPGPAAVGRGNHGDLSNRPRGRRRGASASPTRQASTVRDVLRYFGAPTNGRGEFQGSLTEHLFLNNSNQLRSLSSGARQPDGHAGSAPAPWEERVDQLYLSLLTRLPRAENERASSNS